MIRRLLSLALIALLTVGISLSARADISVNAYVDRNEIDEGESVQYTVEIKGDASKIPALDLAQIPDWQVFSSGTSSNFSWINGQTQQSKQYNFTLMPTRTGRLTIPSFSMTLDGKTFRTPAISVLVNPVAASPSQTRNVPPTRNRASARTNRPHQVGQNDLLLRCTVDRDTVYVNQQITLSTKFLWRVPLLNTPDYNPPQRTGFWTEDLVQSRQSTENYEGLDYNVWESKTALFPTAPGTQTIGPAQMNVVVDEGVSNDPFSFFNQPFPGFGNGRRVDVSSEAVKIVTLPLPDAGKPAGFGGAVGKYDMTVSVDKNKVEVNEPVTLHIKIAGVGNIKSIAMPTIPDLPDFRSYQAGDNEKIEKVNYQVGGTKTFDEAFIPKRAGTYMLPGLKFSYFDPEARAYKTSATDPIQIEVAPSKDRYASQLQNLQGNRIDLAAKDIRYLKPSLGELRSVDSSPLSANPFFLVVMYLLPMLGYFAVVMRQRHVERLQSDVVFRRLRQARKMAESRLSKARSLLDANDADAFYADVNRSLIDYFADRYNLPGFGLTADKIKEFAAGKQIDALVAQMLDLLQQCDFGRFAPGGSEHGQMERVWEDARKLIVELERTR